MRVFISVLLGLIGTFGLSQNPITTSMLTTPAIRLQVGTQTETTQLRNVGNHVYWGSVRLDTNELDSVYVKYHGRLIGKVSGWVRGDTLFIDTSFTRIYSGSSNIVVGGGYPNYTISDTSSIGIDSTAWVHSLRGVTYLRYPGDSVGIGTQTPWKLLDVYGSAHLKDTLFFGDYGDAIWSVPDMSLYTNRNWHVDSNTIYSRNHIIIGNKNITDLLQAYNDRDGVIDSTFRIGPKGDVYAPSISEAASKDTILGWNPSSGEIYAIPKSSITTSEIDPVYAADSGAIKDTLTAHNTRINQRVRSVTATSPVVSSGGYTPNITIDTTKVVLFNDTLAAGKIATKKMLIDSAAQKVYGTGINGYIPHFLNSKKIDSSSLYYDALNKRLGVGHNSPGVPLDVAQTANGYGLLIQYDSNTDGDYAGIGFRVRTQAANARTKGGIFFEQKEYANNSRGKLHFALDAATDAGNVDITDSKMVIDYTGRVGIAKTTPSRILDVVGAAKATDTIITNKWFYGPTYRATNEIAVADGSGNELFGTWAHTGTTGRNTWAGYQAGHTIKLNGGGYTGAQGSINTAVGYKAGYSITTGIYNTLNGAEAGYSTTTGSYNTFNGYGAGYSNTEGSLNTFTGYHAGLENTTGAYSTFNGVGAGRNNKANSRSTAIGYNSMYYADNRTSGRSTYNTAVGYEALRGSTTAANNTGQYNTAVGDQALYGNTSGSGNTSMGYVANYYNTTGSYNTAIGNQSMYNNSTGNGNSAFGVASLNDNTSGSYNTAVGRYSLYRTNSFSNAAIGYASLFSTTGYRNTAMGDSAGFTVTTGNTNSFLGYKAGYNASQKNDAVNSTAIGANSYTDASNQIVFGDGNVTQHRFRAGKVGIGKAADSTLDVSGAIKGTNIYATGKLKVDGTATITGNTELGGTIKIAGGSPGAGKVLTSDADGLASWATNTGAVYKGEVDGDDGKPVGSGTPLIDGTGTIGWYYACSDAGTYDYGNPSGNSITLAVGDQLYYNGSVWLKIPGAGSYTLPAATASTLGGVKVGTSLQISSEVLNINDKDMGDITTSGSGSTWTLDNVNSNIGTYNTITINAKGQATAGSNTDYLDPADSTGKASRTWVIAQDTAVKVAIRAEYIGHDTLVQQYARIRDALKVSKADSNINGSYASKKYVDDLQGRINDSLSNHFTDLTAIYDSLARHTDTLQSHNTRINTLKTALLDSIARHTDTLQSHNTRLLAHSDTLADHLDTLQSHNVRINALVSSVDTLTASIYDSLADHRTDLTALYDTAARHLDSLQSHNTRIKANRNSILSIYDSLGNIYTDDQVNALLALKRDLNNHDSLSTLDEKSYNSLTDKPTSWSISAITNLQDSLNDRYRRKDTATVLLGQTRAASTYVPKTLTVSTTTPLSGGGNLSTNRTIAIIADTLTAWRTKMNQWKNDSANYLHKSDSVAKVATRYWANRTFRTMSNHDSLSTLDEKSYNSLTDKPTSWAISAITGLQDTIDRHTDTLQAHNTRIKANRNSILSIYDSLTNIYTDDQVNTLLNAKQNVSDTNSKDATRYWVRQQAYLTGNQTITLSGDVSGSGTTAITTAVADDSHNHVIGNVDFLQDSLTRIHDTIDNYTHKTRKINTTSPLSGGGNLSADRTLAIIADTLTSWRTKMNQWKNDSTNYLHKSDTNTKVASRYWVGLQGYLTSASITGKVNVADSNKTSTGNYVTTKLLRDSLLRVHDTIDNYTHKTRKLTINGTTQNLSADRTWNVGTVTSIATTSPLTGGTITSSGTIAINTDTLLSWRTKMNQWKNDSANYLHRSDSVLKVATRYWANRTFRTMGNHDSLSTLDEKSYNSLTDKPTSWAISAITNLQDSLNDRYRRKDTATVLLGQTRAASTYVPKTLTISTTSPLAGGGNLSTNRTVSIISDTLTAWRTKMNQWKNDSANYLHKSDTVLKVGTRYWANRTFRTMSNHDSLSALDEKSYNSLTDKPTSWAISAITGLQDSLDRHTDTLQAHNTRINTLKMAVYDSLNKHWDTLVSHNQRLLALFDSTIVQAGIGAITVVETPNNTFTVNNTDPDQSTTNEIQDLSWTAATGTMNISGGGSSQTIPTFSTNSTNPGLVTGSNNAGTSYFLNGNGRWAIPPNTTYSAGFGLVLNGTKFGNTRYWGGQDTLKTTLTGFVKATAGVLSADNSTYLTANQTITLSGDVSGSGTTAITATVADDSHNHVISNVDNLQVALDSTVHWTDTNTYIQTKKPEVVTSTLISSDFTGWTTACSTPPVTEDMHFTYSGKAARYFKCGNADYSGYIEKSVAGSYDSVTFYYYIYQSCTITLQPYGGGTPIKSVTASTPGWTLFSSSAPVTGGYRITFAPSSDFAGIWLSTLTGYSHTNSYVILADDVYMPEIDSTTIGTSILGINNTTGKVSKVALPSASTNYWSITGDTIYNNNASTIKLKNIPYTASPDTVLIISNNIVKKAAYPDPEGGSVESVGLALPSQLTVTGSPITTSGTLTAVWADTTANKIFAGPATGAATKPKFRSLVNADLIGAVKDSTTLTAGTGISVSGTRPSYTITNTAQDSTSVENIGEGVGIYSSMDGNKINLKTLQEGSGISLDGDGDEITISSTGLSNPMTASGDIIYGGVGGTPTRLEKAADGTVLTLASGIPSWQTIPSGFTNPLTATGDILYRSSSNAADRLPIGVTGYVIKSNGTEPVYEPESDPEYIGDTSTIAFLNQANTFTKAQTISGGAYYPLTFTATGGTTGYLYSDINGVGLRNYTVGGSGSMVYLDDDVIKFYSGSTSEKASINSVGQLEVKAITGIAPFITGSTTLVSNLNADQLDGQHSSYFAPYDSLNVRLYGNGTTNTFPIFTNSKKLGDSYLKANLGANLLSSEFLTNRFGYNSGGSPTLQHYNGSTTKVFEVDATGNIWGKNITINNLADDASPDSALSIVDGVIKRSKWPAVGGSGTVTSIATTSPLTGGTITTSGTIAIISDTLTSWRTKMNQWKNDSANYLHKSDTVLKVGTRYWANRTFRTMSNHDSLSTLDEKSYNSLTDKPTSWSISAITALQDSLNDRYRRKDTATVLLGQTRASHDYVPYTGATKDVDLGTKDLTAKEITVSDTLRIGSGGSIMYEPATVGNQIYTTTSHFKVNGRVTGTWLDGDSLKITGKTVEFNKVGATSYFDSIYVKDISSNKLKAAHKNTLESGYWIWDNAKILYPSDTTWSLGVGGAGTVSQTIITDEDITGPMFKITPEGGYAVKMVAGDDVEQGDIVMMDASRNGDTVIRLNDYTGNLIGVAYSDADSLDQVWVVISGIASVNLYDDSGATPGYYATATETNPHGVSSLEYLSYFISCIGTFIEKKSGSATQARIIVRPHPAFEPL